MKEVTLPQAQYHGNSYENISISSSATTSKICNPAHRGTVHIECTKGIFELEGNPTLLNFIQESGLGEKTGTFSGMISLA